MDNYKVDRFESYDNYSLHDEVASNINQVSGEGWVFVQMVTLDSDPRSNIIKYLLIYKRSPMGEAIYG